MQTKLGSAVESGANIVVGFSINYIANLCIFPLFGMHISPLNNFYMGVIYTAISLIRSFVLRRWFNGLKFGNNNKNNDERHETDESEGPLRIAEDRYGERAVHVVAGGGASVP